MLGKLAQVQWVSLHMQGASFPLPPCPNPSECLLLMKGLISSTKKLKWFYASTGEFLKHGKKAYNFIFS